MSRFKHLNDINKRKDESSRIIERYPERKPIIVESYDESKLYLDKIKYLVPSELTVGQFVFVIKKRAKLTPEEALFISIGKTLPSSTSTMGMLYDTYRDEDGFLYFKVFREATFG